MTLDPYQILNISRKATQRDIKLAFYKLSKKWHPDKNPNGVEKFKDIAWAYKILSDEVTKTQYDLGYYHPNTTPSYQPMGHFFNWADIEEMFKNFSKTENMTQAAHTNLDLPLTIKELNNGTVKERTISRRVTCPSCQGLSRFRNCEKCKGLKTIVQEKTFNINIRKGALLGQSLTFIGEGDDIPGNIPGNVNFKFTKIDNDKNWDLEGSNLVRYVNIDLKSCFERDASIYFEPLDDTRKIYQATLGKLPKSKYSKSKKKVQPHNHRHFYIPNMGMPNQLSDECGSLVLVLKPSYPKDLPKTTRMAIKRLEINKIKKYDIEDPSKICTLKELEISEYDEGFFNKQFKKHKSVFKDSNSKKKPVKKSKSFEVRGRNTRKNNHKRPQVKNVNKT